MHIRSVYDPLVVECVRIILKILLFCRITNLELMMDYGTEAWKSYLEVLVKCVAAAQTQVTKLK